MRLASALVIMLTACAPPERSVQATAPSAGAKRATPSNDVAVDGGTSTAAADAAPTRPFAGSVAEATELISAAVDDKHPAISACVRDFRTRKKGGQGRIAISFGIDQEGRLLGVTSKSKEGKEDAVLKKCVQDALKSATFPRSHAGVITVTKTYEEILQ